MTSFESRAWSVVWTLAFVVVLATFAIEFMPGRYQMVVNDVIAWRLDRVTGTICAYVLRAPPGSQLAPLGCSPQPEPQK